MWPGLEDPHGAHQSPVRSSVCGVVVGEPALEGFEEEIDRVWGAALWWLSSTRETLSVPESSLRTLGEKWFGIVK